MSAWKEQALRADFRQAWLVMMGEYGDLVPPPRCYVNGKARAMVGREFAGGDPSSGDLRWHISISYPERVPTWGEMVDAVHELRPGVCFSVGIPPRSWWLNVHEFTLHAWETRDELLLEEYRANATGQRPT